MNYITLPTCQIIYFLVTALLYCGKCSKEEIIAKCNNKVKFIEDKNPEYHIITYTPQNDVKYGIRYRNERIKTNFIKIMFYIFSQIIRNGLHLKEGGDGSENIIKISSQSGANTLGYKNDKSFCDFVRKSADYLKDLKILNYEEKIQRTFIKDISFTNGTIIFKLGDVNWKKFLGGKFAPFPVAAFALSEKAFLLMLYITYYLKSDKRLSKKVRIAVETKMNYPSFIIKGYTACCHMGLPLTQLDSTNYELSTTADFKRSIYTPITETIKEINDNNSLKYMCNLSLDSNGIDRLNATKLALYAGIKVKLYRSLCETMYSYISRKGTVTKKGRKNEH